MEVIVLATMDVVDVMFSPPCLTNLNPRHQHYHHSGVHHFHDVYN